MCFAMPLRSLDSFLWLKRTLGLRYSSRLRFAAACLSLATPRPSRRRCIDGSYFDAPVNYCKAKTLVIQPGTVSGLRDGFTQLKGAGSQPAP
jgi:hypothetical protein